MSTSLAHCVDLHIHSTASDGTDSSATIVEMAVKLGLAAIALTDHDSVAGVPEAVRKGKELGLEVIGGCEFGVETPYGEMHIVSLWPDLRHRGLEALIEGQNICRQERNLEMLEKLNKLGFSLSLQEVEAEASSGGALASLGRPHIALAMQKKGYVQSVPEAFARYLSLGGKAFAPRRLLTPQAMLRELKNVGATTIIAHPLALGAPFDWLEELAGALGQQGLLDGLEAFHPEHDAGKTTKVLELAARHNLLVSGGSDYHGAVKPGIALGRGYGGLKVAEVYLHKMKERRVQQGLPLDISP